MVAATDRERRVGAVGWVDRQLERGAKVLYKGWLEDDRDQSWITGPGGSARAARAAASGQLDFLDFPTVIERCGGTTAGLRRLQFDEVTRALDEGWRAIAVSQESAHRPMADDDEVAEFIVQESAYDTMARRWPVDTLCQLTLDEENPTAIWESAATHHRDLVDPQWACHMAGGTWRLRGTLDAHISQQFGAALYGALRENTGDGGGNELRIDFAGVGFVDLAVMQTLLLTAHTVAHRQRIVLAGASPLVRRILTTVGLPHNMALEADAG